MPGRTFCSRQEMPAFRWCACTRLVESPPTRPHWSVRPQARRLLRCSAAQGAGVGGAAHARPQRGRLHSPQERLGRRTRPDSGGAGDTQGAPTKRPPPGARRRSPDGGAAARGPGGGAGSQWPVGSVAVTVSGGRRGGPGGSP